jgi:outer membrane protein W
MKKLIAACALFACAGLQAQTAPEGPWMIRARAVHLSSANNDSTGLDLSINDKWLPEIDFSYFVTPNFAVELILTVPQKHTVSAGGVEIGSLRHLPPTLTAQYHFTGMKSMRPYVGAGVNYTHRTTGGGGHSNRIQHVPELRRQEGLHQDRRVRSRHDDRNIQGRSGARRSGTRLAILSISVAQA